jgi:molybdate transport system substrate-binding protein
MVHPPQVDNMRAALNLVSRGEAFGIVCATDAKAEPRVKIVDTFPESTHSSIIYPIAIVKRPKNLTP